MVLNYIWIFFFVAAMLVAVVRFVMGDVGIFDDIVKATFDMSKTGFEISLGLTGVLCLWMGIMNVGEKGGSVNVISKLVAPLFRRLFPGLDKHSPAYSSIMMNLSANMLGLDNAATPMGLKAMQQMQNENPNKDRASNAQIMFLVLNTSGLTIIPIAILLYRAQMGAAVATDVFIPILISTFFSTLVGLIVVAIYQKINLFEKVILLYLGSMVALMALVIWYFSSLSKDELSTVSNIVSNFILFGVIVTFILMAAFKRINVYEAFIDGAKEGFGVAVKIIPYLLAILVAVGVFRASGAMDYMISAIKVVVANLGFDTQWVEAFPTALMKPLSGSGARGLMVDAMKTFGPDSFVGRLACCFQGAADTTFYIIAVYFGSVGIKNTRYAVTCGLIADLAGVIAAIVIAYMFFS